MPLDDIREGLSVIGDPVGALTQRTPFGDLVGGINELTNALQRTDAPAPTRTLTSHGYAVYGQLGGRTLPLGAVYGVTESTTQTVTDANEINAISVGLPNHLKRGLVTGRTLTLRAFALSDALFMRAFGRPAAWELLSLIPAFTLVEDDIGPSGGLKYRICYIGVIPEAHSTTRAADDDRLVRFDVTCRWTGRKVLR